MSTEDVDQRDGFAYGVVDPAGRFSTIGNQLVVEYYNFFDVASKYEYPIIVLNVDASGEFVERPFVVFVNERRRFLKWWRSKRRNRNYFLSESF